MQLQTEHNTSSPDKFFKIDKKTYSALSPLIIAEIGTGHNNDCNKGLELISAAVEAGAACVKFQHVYAEEIIHPLTGLVPLPGGNIPLFERFEQLACGPDFLATMKQYCEKAGILFLCTPFGLRSARELRSLGVKAIKVASPELNHFPLLAELADYGLPTILSSGVSLLADIEAALAYFSASPCALLHCVTAYPAPPEDYNLRLLPLLTEIFGVPCGVSDHSMDPVLIPQLAALQGTVLIEKHICLSRDDSGLDDPIALNPSDFRLMVAAVGTALQEPTAAWHELRAKHGRATIEAILGTGKKQLAASEADNYSRTNRSIHALRLIRQGELLSDNNTALLRTEKILRPGLRPELWPWILGRRAIRDIPDGEGIEWADI
jgi:sialic acid synthase SpsE